MKSSSEGRTVLSKLRFVVEVDDRIVCHTYPLTCPSWLHFEQFLIKKLNYAQIKVKYKDEDGDEVNLGSEEEFQEVLKVYQKMNTFLKLHITSVQSDACNECVSTTSVDEDGFPKPTFEEVNNVEEINNADTTSCISYATDDPLPPSWFTSYMDTFKTDVSTDAARKIVHRMQKLMIREGIISTPPKDKEQSSKQNLTTQQGLKRASSPVFCTAPVNLHSRHEDTVHTGITCDNCANIVVGIRYKCGNCVKFDLCEQCEPLQGIHDNHHVFVKILRPAPYAGVKRKTGKMEPLLKHLLYDDADKTTDIRTDREKKLLKRLEKQAHKLEKYKEKQRQRHSDRDGRPYPWDTRNGHSAGNHLHHPHHDNHRHKHSHYSAVKNYVLEEEPILTPRQRQKQAGFIPIAPDKMDAKFVRDETIPDGTKIRPKARFIKRWRVINSGTINWTKDTVLRCLWCTVGFQPGELEVTVPQLAPREEGTISVQFTAPDHTGPYESHWRLYHQGQKFGHRIWCSINVEIRTPRQIEAETSMKVWDLLSGHRRHTKSANAVEVQEPENGEKEQLGDKDESKSNQSDNNFEEVKQLKTGLSRSASDVAVTPAEKDCGLQPPFGSITATPNNTPRDLTPPKSPEPEERDNQENLMSELTMALEDRENASLLSEGESDFGGSLISLSSTDSDLGYVVVPMPPCFNLTVPAVAIHEASASNVVPVNNLIEKEENSSVTTVTDSDEELSKDLPCTLTENTFADASSSGTDEDDKDRTVSETGTLKAVEAESGENVARNFQPPPLKEIAANKADTETKTVLNSEESVHEASEQSEEKNVPIKNPQAMGDRIVPILPEPIMTAAASVFNSARDIFHTIKDGSTARPVVPPLPPTTGVSTMSPPMKQLYDMGFCNKELNERLLVKHGGDVNETVVELLNQTDNEWFANRH